MANAEAWFNSLYEKHYRAVLAYCLRRTNRADAYDAASEVFTVAWRRFEAVPSGDEALRWLYGVARRILSRQSRSATRLQRFITRAGSLRPERPPDTEAIVVQREEHERVLQAAAQLRPTDQEILRLTAWERLPHADIAEMLGCSVAAVDQRLHRAKRRLAKAYKALSSARSFRPPASAEGGEDR